ncbi:S8 family serine peptidase [Streptomyces sp. NPDC088725]|uniref:S8 family peptidase n=1 Tax=Streptomyces sp. NPDC088725 TaxID=3365873 RepID=UPI003815AE2E
MRLRARWVSTALLLLVPLAAGAVSADAQAVPGRRALPVARSADAVPGQYIVTLKPAYSPAAVLRQLRLTPLFTYESALRGFAAVLSPAQLRTVRTLPAVRAVEENARVALDLPRFVRRAAKAPEAERARSTRSAVVAESWGLDRIDQRYLPLDNQFNVNGTGRGVTAYIVDTGIETAHSEFGGRATVGYDAVGDGHDGQDCNFHGTHVAGTTGGATHGVARSVSLVSVRVLNCEAKGSLAGIIAGFDWVAGHARRPAVLNASVGGPVSQALDTAADAVAESGVLPVVAAGNDSKDACDISPARAESVVTVGATDTEDHEAHFSNFGRCLTTYAPGVAIVSAKLGGGFSTLNGTSMASPHVAGVAALYKEEHPEATPDEVAGWLAAHSTKGVVAPIGAGSPDRLLYTDGL